MNTKLDAVFFFVVFLFFFWLYFKFVEDMPFKIKSLLHYKHNGESQKIYNINSSGLD